MIKAEIMNLGEETEVGEMRGRSRNDIDAVFVYEMIPKFKLLLI